MDLFGSLYKSAEDWTFAWLNRDQVPDQAGPKDVEPDTAYLTGWLRSGRLVYRRELWSRLYGVTHSVIGMAHKSSDKPVEFRKVIAPDEFKNVDPKRLDKVIMGSQPLVGPVPYRGGILSFQLGLFAIQSTDLLAPYLSLLDDMSKQAGVWDFSRPLWLPQRWSRIG